MRRPSIMKTALCAGLVLAFASGGCIVISDGNLRGKANRMDNLTVAVGSASALRVTTNVGAINLDPANTTEVHVTANVTVKAKTDEEAAELLPEVHVTAEASGDEIVVKADKPSDFGRNQLTVDLTITAPAGLRLYCTTNVGNIRADGFTGRVEAHTDVGAITCDNLHGTASLHTNVGDVRATYVSDAPAALDVSISTNVGKIDFTGPSQISAQVGAGANVGDVHTSRPLTVTGSVGKSVSGTLGDGQGHIDLRTNVGSITIH